MNRRHFLNMVALAPALALDPERLLWIPGKRKIFVPSGIIRGADLDYEWIDEVGDCDHIADVIRYSVMSKDYRDAQGTINRILTAHAEAIALLPALSPPQNIPS